ncbi:MAG: NADH-quinone oxidoreductase subunit L [Candidatus Omnitrophica bacterium]|nr:NADH-quinone oxidoreductase subunit L [Candidatus Omnitrophota bacterium]
MGCLFSMPGITILLAVFVPIVGSAILPFAGIFSKRLRNALSFFLVFASFCFSLTMLPRIMSGGQIFFFKAFPLGLNLSFTADALAVFMALVSSAISAIIIFYSFGYISHYEHQTEYYSMVTLFLGSMMGLVFSSNLILLYIFWELTAICSWRLIGFFREKLFVLRADKAFLMTFFGALLMLAGFLIIYQQAGSFELSAIKETFKNNPISNLAVLFVLIGILSKSATLPFQAWLPDAGVAPSPVTALLHAAVLVKIGVYVFARLFVFTFNVWEIWHTIVPAIAAVSAIVSAGCALVETDIKRIIAYSTISQIAFIFLGLSTNVAVGIAGGLLYILMHGISKAGLFLCAGIVEQNTKVKDITKLGGLIKTMPLTAVSFLLCAFSVMGIPPFGGFFSKYMVFNSAIESGHIVINFVFLIGAFMTVLYLVRLFNLVFMGEPQSGLPREGSRTMVTAVMILGALSLASGIFVYYPFQLAQLSAFNLTGLIR